MNNKSLRQWRIVRGMTISELSEKSGISERAIKYLENDTQRIGRAKISTLESLCKVLGIKLSRIDRNV